MDRAPSGSPPTAVGAGRIIASFGSLQVKLTLAIVGITLTFVWGLAIYAAARLQAQIKAVTMEQQFAMVQYLAAELDQKLHERLDGLQGIATGLDTGRLGDQAYLNRFLEERYVFQRQFTGGTAIIGGDGRTIADYPVAAGRRGTYYGDRDYFTQAAATRQPYIDKPIMGRALKRPVMTMSVPLIDAAGAFRGVMTGIVDLTAPNFLGLMTDRRMLGDFEFYVVAPQHEIFVTASDPRRVMTATPAPGKSEINDALRKGFEGSLVARSSFGIEKLYSLKRVPATGWVVELALPTEIAFRPARNLRNTLYGAALLATFIVMLVVGLIARRLLAPLEEAAARLDAMSSGRVPQQRLPERGDTEVRRLLASFNRLTDHLRESEETYRSLFANMLNGFAHCRMIFTDGKPSDFIYLDVNEAFTTLTGLKDVVGKPVSEVIPGIQESDPGLFEAYARVATTGKSERFEVYVAAVNMWFWIAVYSPKPEHFVAVFDVITERKIQEQQILELNRSLEVRVQRRTEDLERANRELEAFSYSISHDLRAPLRAINGFSKLVLEHDREQLSTDSRHMLERVAHNANRMGELIDDILNYSRTARAEMIAADVDLNALALAAIDQLRDNYPATRFRCGDLPVVHGDATMLRQVVANLLENAAKFSSARAAAVVEIDCATAATEHVISVRDNGAGFDMRYAGKLFGMFQRMHTESQFPGTGVGLAIVKRLVERNGGRVWATAELGKGATFYFALPVAPT